MYDDITINGKRYVYTTFFKKKKDAEEWKKHKEKYGYKCKLIKGKNKKGDTIYRAYCRKL